MNNKGTAVNTALLTITLAVMSWVGVKTAANSESLAGLRATSEATEKANMEAHARTEALVKDTVPRREFDQRMIQIETDLRKTEARLQQIDVELIKLKNKT